MYFKIISIIFPFLLNKVESKCDTITATVSQRISNMGFHREIKYEIDLSEIDNRDIWTHEACRLSLRQVLPSGAYVSSDELKDFRRHHKLHASPDGQVDIEKPKHMSSPIAVRIFSTLDSPRLKFSLPIHLRYHRAKPKGGYETVKIKAPWILLRCPAGLTNKICTSEKVINAPCIEFSQRQCSWHNLTTNVITRPLNVAVPVGNLDDFMIVIPITIIACFGGCLFLLISLSKNDLSKKIYKKIK